MNAYTRGEKLGVLVTNAGHAVAKGSKTVGKGTVSAARGTKDAAKSFWTGFRAGLKQSPQIEAPKTKVEAPKIIIVTSSDIIRR